VQAGAESLVVYQETYDREVYAEMHESGPKRNFDWRLDSLERGYAAGFRRIQAGALLGLADWRFEALALAEHIEYLLKNCWRAFVSVSLPRLRPCAGEFQPLTGVSDRDFLQIICALRVTFPQIGITLSTRENPLLRESLAPLGITLMSAGSHTEPGGYTGQGSTRLHHTVKGRQVELQNAGGADAPVDRATGQFQISDERSAAQIARMLLNKGFEPVWKDWDQTLAEAAAASSPNSSSLAA
jgi:2-iminoacetate synthase